VVGGGIKQEGLLGPLFISVYSHKLVAIFPGLVARMAADLVEELLAFYVDRANAFDLVAAVIGAVVAVVFDVFVLILFGKLNSLRNTN
jgi:uncharacterized membrane protein YeaQ/YmgE (transglycosylase-associated protein family)